MIMQQLSASVKELNTSVIIALDCGDDAYLRKLQLQFDPDEIVSDLHITLLFLGDAVDESLNKAEILKRLYDFASVQAPIDGKYQGISAFAGDGEYARVVLYDSPQLPAMFSELAAIYRDIRPDLTHGFTAHTTLAYTYAFAAVPFLDIHYEKHFDTISLWFGNDHTSIPLTGTVVTKQLPINDSSKQALIRARTEIFYRDADALAERMYTGSITLGSYEESMRKMVRELYSANAAIGKGGWENMTQSDWGKIGNPVKEQYRYLHGFIEHIADNRDTISLNAIQARARMYGNSAGYVAELMQAGPLASQLPWIPKDGSTECIVNCKCHWELTVINTLPDQSKLVQAVWKIDHDAESCDDCIKRIDYTTTIIASPGTPIPSVIGGF